MTSRNGWASADSTMPANRIWPIRNEPSPELAHQQHRVAHMHQPCLHPALELVSASVFWCLGER